MSSQAVGSGTGFLIREPFTQLPTSHTEFSSFESSSVTLKLLYLIQENRYSIYIVLLRLPPSPNLFFVFLDQFNSFLSFAATTSHEFIITGDFNIHLDNQSDHATSQFFSLLSSFNLTQHVNFPTRNQNHILDLVITSSDSLLAPSLSTTHCSPSDHFPIFTKLSVDRTPLPPPTFHSFRRLYSIDINSFLSDLRCCRLITNPTNSLGSLLIAYNTTLSFLLDKHAPVVTKFSSRKSKSNPRFISTLRAFKSTVRRAKNIWKRTHSAPDWSSFKSLRNRYQNFILASKKQYYSNLVCSSSDNPRLLWQTINKLLHRNSSSPLPTCTSASALADSLASFFIDKIFKLRLSL